MLIHTIDMIHISPSFEELVVNTMYPGVIRNPLPGDPAVIYQNKAFLKVVFFFFLPKELQLGLKFYLNRPP